MTSVVDALAPFALAMLVQVQNMPAPPEPAPPSDRIRPVSSHTRVDPVSKCRITEACLAAATGKSSSYCRESRVETSCPGKVPSVLLRSNAEPAAEHPFPAK